MTRNLGGRTVIGHDAAPVAVFAPINIAQVGVGADPSRLQLYRSPSSPFASATEFDFPAGKAQVFFVAVFRNDSVAPGVPTLASPGASFTTVVSQTLSSGTMRARLCAFATNGYTGPTFLPLTLTAAEAGTADVDYAYTQHSLVLDVDDSAPGGVTTVRQSSSGTGSGTTLNVTTPTPLSNIDARAIAAIYLNTSGWNAADLAQQVTTVNADWVSDGTNGANGNYYCFLSTYPGATDPQHGGSQRLAWNYDFNPAYDPGDPTDVTATFTAQQTGVWAWVSVEL